MNKQGVILAPIISEKSTKDAAFGKFTFRVDKKANKNVIKKAIEDKFKVNVVGISTVIVKGRKARFGARRIETDLPIWKKAIVALKKDQKIDLFETGGGKTS